jgi:hypothetical protein
MSRLISDKSRKILILMITFLFLINFIIFPINAFEETLELKLDVHLPIPGLVEGQESEFIIEVINNGDSNVSVGEVITIKLKIDSNYVAMNSSEDGLPAGSSIFINLSWTPTYEDVGEHDLRFELYHEDQFIGPPVEIKNVDISERESQLVIIDFDVPENIVVSQNSLIQASIVNYGKNTKSPIYAKLNSSEEGEIKTVIKSGILRREETYVFFFNWTPTRFGSQTLSIDIVYNNRTHDYKEKNIIVEIGQLKWWDENWHYRYFLSVNGSGNVSKSFNFTDLLEDLDATGEFENDTIRIIEYDQSGDIIDVVEEYNFKENIDYINKENAVGTLIWNAIGKPLEKFYCIYFDVTINLGNRDELPETPGISPSGDATIGYFSFVEGWYIDSLLPADGSYCLIEDCVDILVTTTSKAENVSAFIFFNDDESYNSTIYLSNKGDDTHWIYENLSFDFEGNWTIQITARDWTGYKSKILSHSIFVGKPDIEAINLSFSTNWAPTSPKIYRNDTVSITALIISHDANIDNVEVSLELISNDLGTIHYDKKIINLKQEVIRYLSFKWVANVSGEITVIITVDPDDNIDEDDESNNEIVEEITVYEWPDLAVNGIIFPSATKTEFDRVQIDVVIKNIGFATATDYVVKLYIEKDIMTYTNEVDNKVVSVNVNASKTINLFWDSAEPGHWLVGAFINYSDKKRDTNVLNNWFSSNNVLTIRGIERYPPTITIENISRNREQGETVEIAARITDNSGIESVKIKVTDPKNKSFSNTMVRSTGDVFIYNFKDTFEDGKYKLIITAIDLTIYRNKNTISDSFIILEDTIFPVVSYFIADPYVQLKGNEVSFYCIASDNNGVNTVEINVELSVIPTDSKTNIMEESSDGKFEFKDTYDKPGNYSYYVNVYDYAGGKTTTYPKTFWITSDIDDTDNDGIPDQWETKYGLDSEDPDDADLDFDKDGISNLEEYNAGTNPSKDIFIENVAFRVRDNIYYLIGSIILFLLLVILPYIDKWRKLR